ncbi:hypothetical protein K3495_g5754 [Podosphaera aphanis]|nr:hypothetical protein K3495_g5754 [Podosphaera aphanis]
MKDCFANSSSAEIEAVQKALSNLQLERRTLFLPREDQLKEPELERDLDPKDINQRIFAFSPNVVNFLFIPVEILSECRAIDDIVATGYRSLSLS